MTQTMIGRVTVVQEGRLMLTDDRGVSHLFILGANAAAEASQLAPLQVSQARIVAHYTGGKNIIGNLLSAIEIA